MTNQILEKWYLWKFSVYMDVKMIRFLLNCYQNLEGQAEYRLLLENDLVFTVSMMLSGHAVIRGTFQERPDKDSILMFEVDTDQSCFLSVIQTINNLEKTNGGMQGIKEVKDSFSGP